MKIMSDKRKEQVSLLKGRVHRLGKSYQKKVIVRQADALYLDTYEDGFVERIVTDPPWGFFDEMKMDLSVFYLRMLNEFDRVLKAGGILILLTSQREVLESVIESRDCQLKLQKKYDILVSGKKASIYKLLKEMNN